MALDPLEPDPSERLDYDANEEYRALLRALRRQQGFGILFVRCSPERGSQLIEELRRDLPQKRCERLTLSEPVSDGDFFGRAAAFLAEHPADVVFVEGMRHSLLEYEDIKRASGWSEAETLNYSWKDVPPILRNLNQQRDEFRNRLPACFVFLVSPFLVKYLRRRAPDFFDWRSGVFEFKDSREAIASSLEADLLKDYNEVRQMTPEERRWVIIRLMGYLEDSNLSADERFKILFDLGLYQFADGSVQDASLSLSEALKNGITLAENFVRRGRLLAVQTHHEEAISSYDQALKIQSGNNEAWLNRGNSLKELGRYEEAIISYDQALKIKPSDYSAWNSRGVALDELGRYEEAIASYDKALENQVDDYTVWNNRGIALDKIGRYEEAIADYDQAFKFKSDLHYTWCFRGSCLNKLGHYEAAITSYDKAIAIKPDDYVPWLWRGNALKSLERYDEAIASYDKAISIKPDSHRAWINRGLALRKLKRTQEARASFRKAFELNPQATIDTCLGGSINQFLLLKGFLRLVKKLISRLLSPKISSKK